MQISPPVACNRSAQRTQEAVEVTVRRLGSRPLADPTRRAILARLSRGEATVNELAKPFEISLPSISRHLKVLEGAGLISRGREAQWRPCKLKPGPLREVDGWLERYRKFWTGGFDRMDALLEELGQPLLGTTLIMPGETQPLNDAEEIRAQLEKQLDLVIDGGACPCEPSTIVDLTGAEPVLVRAGRGSLAPFGLEQPA